MTVLLLGICCIALVACIIGIVGEIMAENWIPAALATVPTGLFLCLVIFLSIAAEKEIH